MAHGNDLKVNVNLPWNVSLPKTSTTNRSGVRDPHAHYCYWRAHTLIGTVIWLFIPASVHCTLVVHLFVLFS